MPVAVVLVGGLGGGGDVGLAVVLSSLLRGVSIVYASFAGCAPRKYGGRRVAGSLFVPVDYHPRDFEWALKALNPSLPVYRICVRAERGEVEEALEWLAHRYRPSCSVHTDIGGDGLLTGYEESLGSYTADTLARAALAEASERHGWRSLLAVGGLQLEGGRRRVLSLEEQVASLLYYEAQGALLGVVDPPRDSAALAKALLYQGNGMVSVMLPLYLAALEGRPATRIGRGRSAGYHRLDWWARYVFVLDNAAACSASPLCSAARRGWLSGIEEWTAPEPRGSYASALKRAKRDPEEALRGIIRRHADNSVIERACRGATG